jgi:2-methylcitrate dehydratase
MDSIAGRFYLDWNSEPLDAVLQTIVKRYNAEIHSQSTLEGIFELRRAPEFDPYEIERVEIEIFDVAYNIIGGGDEGDKLTVRTKEEADHSLRYLAAVALLDGQVMPEQYEPARIAREDVQRLLQRVCIRPSPEFSHRFPDEMPARVTLIFENGLVSSIEKRDYRGFHTRPMDWAHAIDKFNQLAAPFAGEALCREIVEAVRTLEAGPIRDLVALLSRVPREKQSHVAVTT